MRVMIDACVLYPTVMREVVLGIARAGLFEARWSDRVLEEWARAAAKMGPEAAVFARAEIASLALDFPKARIDVPEAALRKYRLPDPDDVHVLAAAVLGSCDGIMTMNNKDFPRGALAEEGLARYNPDEFCCRMLAEDEGAVRAIAEAVLARARQMSGSDWTMRGLMKKARLPRFGKAL